MDSPDIDAFGILEPYEPHETAESTAPGGPRPSPESESVAEMEGNRPHPSTLPATPAVSTTGDRSITAGRDIHQPRNIDMRNSVVAGEEIVEQLAQAHAQPRTDRGLQDPEALRLLAERYVPPQDLLGETPGDEPETAFEVLHGHKFLVIGAQEDHGGQFAASKRLGFELRERHPGLVVREEVIDSEFRLRAEKLLLESEPAAVLIDLRDEANEDIQAVRRDMMGFTRQLERYRSFLIVIIPSKWMSAFEESFPGKTHLLGKPSPVEVFVQHLTRVDARALVEETGCVERLERLWPPQVAEMAEAVSDRIDRDESPEEALKSVLDSESHVWTSTLRQEIERRQQEGNFDWLGLLLAAAVLEGATAQHIVDASGQLLRCNELDVEQPVPLLRPSPVTKLFELTKEYFDPDGRQFPTPGFGPHVLRHFWSDHPDLHEPMLTWLGGLPHKIRDLDSSEMERIADRVAELAEEGGASIALRIARTWGRASLDKDPKKAPPSTTQVGRYQRSIAVRLLTNTAMHSTLGREVRQRLLAWSRDRTNIEIQLLTAEVCAGIGQSFPRIALTRLKHLANSEDDRVRAAVLDAVRRIGGELGTSRFLSYVEEWFDDASPPRLRMLSESVSGVLSEQSEQVEADSATSFWQRAVDTMPPEYLRPAVESWIRAAAAGAPGHSGEMVEPLVRATGSQWFRIVQMQRASRFGPNPPDLRGVEDESVTEVVHQLWTRLDEVDPVWQ
ncbi:HEAT repeat domain-containing protein [Actinopolyspora saharensis]|uniref:HEAT repeat domain-containing protein n=1 Tax=Actinopolyspora saharensis TaxID=995062 RepID=UPI003F6806B1